MRRYIITLLIIAFLVGTLFKAADQTGVRLMKMFGTLGIFLFGVVGTMALTRWQSRSGLKDIEERLKQAEPDGLIITDWAQQGGGKPDYLVVGPGGIAAICLEETAGSTRAKRAALNVAKGRERAQAAVRWLRDRLNTSAPDLKAPLGELVQELPVSAVLVMTRRRAEESYSAEDVAVINPDRLGDELRNLKNQHLLDEAARIKLTRLFRQA